MFLNRFTVLTLSVVLSAGAVTGSFAARAKKGAAADGKTAAVNSAAVVDAMEITQGWEIYTDNGSKLALTSVAGKSGKAIEAAYDFGGGGWIAFNKAVNADFSKAKGIKFYYKGTGSSNSVEIKLEDEDGTNFGFLLVTKSNVAGWTSVEIPFSELKYFWGGNPELNWTKIIRFHFAVSRKEGDEGGAGKVDFDQLELMK